MPITNVAGDVVAVVPDFDPGEAVRVLPDPAGANIVDAEDGWEFAGPTRHPATAVIRDCRRGSTVHVDRTRLTDRQFRRKDPHGRQIRFPRDEVLHRIVLDGVADDTVGDVQTWGHIYDGLRELSRQSIRDGYAGVLTELGVSVEQFPDGSSWIVCEDRDGFIDVDQFSSVSDYQAAISNLEREYDEFSDGGA